jgi:hypothetical protein
MLEMDHSRVGPAVTSSSNGFAHPVFHWRRLLGRGFPSLLAKLPWWSAPPPPKEKSAASAALFRLLPPGRLCERMHMDRRKRVCNLIELLTFDTNFPVEIPIAPDGEKHSASHVMV